MQTIALSMDFWLIWMEPRLQINESATEWTDTTSWSPELIHVSSEILTHIWYPDLLITKLKYFKSRSILKEQAELGISKNKSIFYQLTVDVKIACSMNFDRYPLDVQHCPFEIMSYYFNNETVACTSRFEYSEKNQRSLQHFIKFEQFSPNTKSFGHTFCGFNILLSRRRMVPRNH